MHLYVRYLSSDDVHHVPLHYDGACWLCWSDLRKPQQPMGFLRLLGITSFHDDFGSTNQHQIYDKLSLNLSYS